MSPPANIMTVRLTLDNVHISLKHLYMYYIVAKFQPIILLEKFISSLNFGPVTDRRKAMHKSPPCFGTGRLNKAQWAKKSQE